ncbi:uncharacterized protein LOC125541801 [Triticum urartu]|uniref:uncharacterized protein LOC125541801 n=1 Tax=Triticum urartu TaxID=4572 RepID=UPI002044A2F0|nr:uncharacterized protein LOC125541801 [Triticum urartu]
MPSPFREPTSMELAVASSEPRPQAGARQPHRSAVSSSTSRGALLMFSPSSCLVSGLPVAPLSDDRQRADSHQQARLDSPSRPYLLSSLLLELTSSLHFPPLLLTAGDGRSLERHGLAPRAPMEHENLALGATSCRRSPRPAPDLP